MNDKIKVFALGGLDEKGKNLLIVEINDNIFVFDCGLKYPHKSIPGVDALIPNFDYLKENKDRVKAYIITHGHDDKMGGLPYVYREVPAPIVTTQFTAGIIEMFSKKVGINNKYKFILVDGHEFLTISGYRFHFTQVTHSIPFSFACSVETSQGNIIYTSDMIIDYNNLAPSFKFSTKNFLHNEGKEALMLLSDSTNAHLKGSCSPRYMITPHVKEIFENSTGRIFAALYGQNMMNFFELLTLAEKTNKTVVFAQKDATPVMSKLYQDICCSKIPAKIKYEQLENISRIRDKDVLVLLLGEGSTLFENIISFVNGGFSSKSIDFTSDDTFILNCPAVPTNEVLGTEALDEVYKTGCKVINFSRKVLYSMHACEEDIKTLITFFNPKYYVPISGSFTNMMTNAKIALNLDKKYNYSNILVPDNGMVINCENGICKIDYKNLIPTSNVMIDGKDIGNVGNNVIEERNRLSNDGVVIMGITISSKTQEIVAGPDVQMRGFVFLKDSENILHTIIDLFLDQIRVYLTGYTDEVSVEDNIIDRVTRYIRRETGKNPVIIPAILDIDK